MMFRRIIDTALEATIVGSFTRIGPMVRSQVDGWPPIETDLSATTVLVTGGSTGLGRETARRLVGLGAEVLLTSRSFERAESVAAELNETAAASGEKAGRSAGRAFGAAVDTGDLDSVGRLVGRVVEWIDDRGGTLDVVVHNAGALLADHETTVDGIERTVASHLVGPYALTKGLRPHLSSGARVLWMSSGGMYTQRLDVDGLEMEPHDYRGSVAYARAKRAQVELVTHLGPRWAPDVVLQAMHPGWVDTDGVADALPGFGTVMGPLLRDVEAGADTMVWLAAGGGEDDSDGGGAGRFWLDRRPRPTAYLPGTSTDEAERARLVEWLEAKVTPT